MKRPYPQTPVEFTQTIDVYDSDEGGENGVKEKASEVSGQSGAEEDDSVPPTPDKKASVLSDQSDDGNQQ